LGQRFHWKAQTKNPPNYSIVKKPITSRSRCCNLQIQAPQKQFYDIQEESFSSTRESILSLSVLAGIGTMKEEDHHDDDLDVDKKPLKTKKEKR